MIGGLIAWPFRRSVAPAADSAVAIEARRARLREQLEQACADRRIGREERQAAALRREAAKVHAHFVRDPVIRALRPDLIREGEHP